MKTVCIMFPPMNLEKAQCCDITRSEDKSFCLMSTAEAEDDPERT